jgi:hypothetical protein
MSWLLCTLPVVFAAATIAPTSAVAQIRIEAIPDSVLRPYSTRENAPSALSPAVTHSAPKFEASDPRFRDYSWLGGAVQVESPRIAADGSYSRPKLMLGLPSEAMKDWMHSAGFAADKCLLPMVRARARINADGEAYGTLWLYARCSFQ